MAGRPTGAVFRLPVDWAPIAAVRTGLLLTSGGGGGNSSSFAVWDPHTTRTIWSAPPAAQLLAANDHLVAWIAGYGCQPLCALHLTDVVTGSDRAIYPGSGNPPWTMSPGAFSPDGRRLALGVTSNTETSSGTNGLIVVDTVVGSSTFVSIGSAPGSIIAWAPSGRWIFMLASDNNSANVVGYPLGGSGAEAVNLPPSMTATAFVAI